MKISFLHIIYVIINTTLQCPPVLRFAELIYLFTVTVVLEYGISSHSIIADQQELKFSCWSWFY